MLLLSGCFITAAGNTTKNREKNYHTPTQEQKCNPDLMEIFIAIQKFSKKYEGGPGSGGARL